MLKASPITPLMLLGSELRNLVIPQLKIKRATGYLTNAKRSRRERTGLVGRNPDEGQPETGAAECFKAAANFFHLPCRNHPPYPSTL
jgi:hypothetical protein